MSSEEALERQYRSFLREHGVSEDFLTIPREALEAFDREARERDVRDGLSRSRVPLSTDANSAIRYQSRQILAAIKSSPVGQLEIATLTGIFPTGSINAQARRCSGGALILINEGLIAFIQQFIGILLQYSAVQDRLLSVVPPDRFGRAKTVRSLAEIFTDYVKRGANPSLSRKYCPVGGYLGRLHTILNAECSYFVLAHEHAHAALGHLGKERQMRVATTPVGDIHLIEKSWQEEAAADVAALQLQLVLSKSQEEMFARLPFVFASIWLFFSIDGLVDRLHREVADVIGVNLPIICDHPPGQLRLRAINEWLIERQANDAVFGRAEAFREPLNELEDDLIKAVLSEVEGPQ